jgi:hypothetical protein
MSKVGVAVDQAGEKAVPEQVCGVAVDAVEVPRVPSVEFLQSA